MIRVALNHKTFYTYDRPVELGPQVIRLRPAPHCRTPICSYSLSVKPTDNFLNWQQDPHSNFLARMVFHQPARELHIEVDLVAEMTVINPFDFFLEPSAAEFPFVYDAALAKDLLPFLDTPPVGPLLSNLVQEFAGRQQKTIDFLVELNQRVQQKVGYTIRLEPGVQEAEATLEMASGSCRDSAWLLVQVLRNLGLAARFVSGYLIQLKPDLKSLDGPSGTEVDFTDLHAWAEVFLPGAGWIGMDPTSGLFAGEGHIPLACTPVPTNAAPISGNLGECEVQFHHEMTITRVYEDPRVTKPYSDEQWEKIQSVGEVVDQRLNAGDVRLTMGGEPTFVSIDDVEGDEWKTAAVGPTKRKLAANLLNRLQGRFANGGLFHVGQGKWYPGEPLPRWALTVLWRIDGQPIWQNPEWLANPEQDYGHSFGQAQHFANSLSKRLGLDSGFVQPAYENLLHYLSLEQQLPVGINVLDADLDDAEERNRLARVFGNGLNNPVGCLLPLAHRQTVQGERWISGLWPVRSERLQLLPGDSPMGLRLPLDSLPALRSDEVPFAAVTPFDSAPPIEVYDQLRQQISARDSSTPVPQQLRKQQLQSVGVGGETIADYETHPDSHGNGPSNGSDNGHLNGHGSGHLNGHNNGQDRGQFHAFDDASFIPDDSPEPSQPTSIIRTAMCVETRAGKVHVFMPPVERLESYLELVAAIEDTASELNLPVIVEGYLPPVDYRLRHIKVTPDPGVIEVNVQPADSWSDLVDITRYLYEDARQSRLGTEKFDTDGQHTGTGGGNHIVMGALRPSDSPFLRRPDLLRSLVGYWHNHPSLSYLFSGRFIGPTSQAPRVDEGRLDATYELQIAFEQIRNDHDCPPWLVDRVFRHLLVDLTGNTHRSEFCIDKLYSPDSSTGRLGLVEFRAFEMPPHWQMSLAQQLLLRSLVARFWDQPYTDSLVDWHTSIHDRWMLPHFVQHDFDDVIEQTAAAGIKLEVDWFAPHFEFRFPLIGAVHQCGIDVQFRTAIEPWYVLGEEPAGGATARYVDSSVERMEVKVRGMSDDRYVITCNGRRVPLHPTGTEGEYVAGVRYRAWQPPSCLHPTIPVDEPLIFDIIDTWNGRSIGGCKYHVGHPGGKNDGNFPVNSLEAESRRAARFFKMGHTGGKMNVPIDEKNPSFPMTLDLRRKRHIH